MGGEPVTASQTWVLQALAGRRSPGEAADR